MTSKCLKTCKFTNARLTRWMLAIQDYKIEIEHLPSKDNRMADVLSRLHSEENQRTTKREAIVKINSLTHQCNRNLKTKLDTLSIRRSSYSTRSARPRILTNPRACAFRPPGTTLTGVNTDRIIIDTRKRCVGTNEGRYGHTKFKPQNTVSTEPTKKQVKMPNSVTVTSEESEPQPSTSKVITSMTVKDRFSKPQPFTSKIIHTES